MENKPRLVVQWAGSNGETAWRLVQTTSGAVVLEARRTDTLGDASWGVVSSDDKDAEWLAFQQLAQHLAEQTGQG